MEGEQQKMVFSTKLNDEYHKLRTYLEQKENTDTLALQIVGTHLKNRVSHKGFYISKPIQNVEGGYDYVFHWIDYERDNAMFEHVIVNVLKERGEIRSKIMKEIEKDKKDAGLYCFLFLHEKTSADMVRVVSMSFLIHEIEKEMDMMALSFFSMLYNVLSHGEVENIFSGSDADYFNQKENGT